MLPQILNHHLKGWRRHNIMIYPSFWRDAAMPTHLTWMDATQILAYRPTYLCTPEPQLMAGTPNKSWRFGGSDDVPNLQKGVKISGFTDLPRGENLSGVLNPVKKYPLLGKPEFMKPEEPPNTMGTQNLHFWGSWPIYWGPKTFIFHGHLGSKGITQHKNITLVL